MRKSRAGWRLRIGNPMGRPRTARRRLPNHPGGANPQCRACHLFQTFGGVCGDCGRCDLCCPTNGRCADARERGIPPTEDW